MEWVSKPLRCNLDHDDHHPCQAMTARASLLCDQKEVYDTQLYTTRVCIATKDRIAPDEGTMHGGSTDHDSGGDVRGLPYHTRPTALRVCHDYPKLATRTVLREFGIITMLFGYT